MEEAVILLKIVLGVSAGIFTLMSVFGVWLRYHAKETKELVMAYNKDHKEMTQKVMDIAMQTSGELDVLKAKVTFNEKGIDELKGDFKEMSREIYEEQKEKAKNTNIR